MKSTGIGESALIEAAGEWSFSIATVEIHWNGQVRKKLASFSRAMRR